VITALLISFAVGAHFETANTFRREWENQGNFFWQLSWRAPAIRPGTLLLTYDLPFQYDTDYSLTAPLNWMYAPQQAGPDLPYLLFFIKNRLGGGLDSARPNIAVNKDLRSFTFSGSTNQTLLFFYSPPGCLRILDPSRPEEWVNLPQSLVDASSLARPELVESSSAATARPPANFFNAEPAHQWCYDFEKADLARQGEDWAKVASLGDAALKLPLQAQEPVEYFAFIEGYARSARLEQAEALSQTAAAKSGLLKPNLCALWHRLGKTADLQPAAARQQLKLGCRLN